MATKAGGGGQVKSLVVTLYGAVLAAYTAGSAKLTMPERGKIVGITMNVGGKGGTHSTSTLDVLEGATSLLAALIDVAAATAGTPVQVEGSGLAAAADVVAKDAELVFTMAESGGSSPTAKLLTVQVDYVPLGD
jgi:hypothetical protein